VEDNVTDPSAKEASNLQTAQKDQDVDAASKENKK